MSAIINSDVANDTIARTAAEIIAAANLRVRSLGIDPMECRITVSNHVTTEDSCWRVHYGHKNPVGRRGGDITIEVDSMTGGIIQVIRGQ